MLGRCKRLSGVLGQQHKLKPQLRRQRHRVGEPGRTLPSQDLTHGLGRQPGALGQCVGGQLAGLFGIGQSDGELREGAHGKLTGVFIRNEC